MADDQTPENPFESQSPDHETPVIENGGGLSQGTPNVAAKAGKTFIVLGIVGAVVLFLIYSIFSSDKKKTVKEEPTKREVAKKTVELPPPPVQEPIPINIPEPEKVGAPPIAIPAPPAPPAPPIDINQLSPKEDSAAKAQALARLKSNMMVKDGGGGGGIADLTGGRGTQQAQQPAPQTDPNLAFEATVANTRAERVQATRIGDLHRTIAQGRIIQATMESALNTDLRAPIRAIVSRDVYGEAGRTPLIPKGSRLIGQYNALNNSGQTRVFVVWSRVIRPDGVDVMLGSPLVDAIGQAGVTGQIDSKFQEIFARSLVSSVMNIALAIGSDKINGEGSSSTTTTPEGGSTTTGDAATTATNNALNRLGNTTDTFIQRFMNVPPTILVDQGTKVNVFVNRDLVFPADVTGAHILQ